ncbi:MAG: zinc-dependent metalloprotease [Myxococcales bacterium]|nr:zinc-dependent metalloprotease [Myxococcales bacterium]
MSKNSVRRWLGALSMLGFSLLAGCAEERAPINRVQADALAKSFFVGEVGDPKDDPEFYMRVTVVDVDSGAGSDGLFTNSDAQPTMRVRWEITEDLLIARLTYERIENTDGKGVRRTPDGQAVAAYTIDSHFDIKRSYNENTGEELNVVEENDQDRPWYKRAYFRVDWSKNLITSAYELDTLSQLGIYYGVQIEPIAYYVNDPAHQDTPVFDRKRGYFDVTHKVWAKPQVIKDEIYGDFPACWLYGSFPSVNCNPSEVTLRQSYLKIADTDYEPLEYDGTKMDMFGLFTVDRFGYDRSYGVVDDKWHRFGTRWNLWQRSHADPVVACNTPDTTPVGADPHRDDDADGTEDECASVGRGSRCDAVTSECTLPLRDRQAKTIAWHVNPGFPDDLFESSKEMMSAWNDAVRVGVLAGRLAECRRTGEQGCETTHGWPARWSDDFVPPVGATSPVEVPNFFVLCHNPVSSELGDDPACGADKTAPRIGDLRYNILAVVQDPQIMAPWGIMMDAEDPLTGEKIAGSVAEWGAVLDRAASTVADLVALINGQIKPDDYIKGQNVKDWVSANQPKGPAEKLSALPKDELSSRLSAFDPQVITPYLAGAPKPKPMHHPLAKRAARAKFLLDSGRLGPGNAALAARLSALRGTAVEASLVSPEMLQASGADPAAPPSAEAIRRASPFDRKMNPTLRAADRRARQLGNARRHACRYDAAEPDNLLGLARALVKKFPPPADPSDKAAANEHRRKIVDWARAEFNKGVLAHEVGHSMGLRHNFGASFDSLNYDPEYWQLRTNDGVDAAKDCPAGTTDGSACVGPRWRDPISDKEIDGEIQRYSTSSVMDYPGEQSQDMLLPGKYDRAAVRFTYGNVLDVWSKDGVSVDAKGAGQTEAYKLTAFATSPGLFGVYYFPPTDVNNPYTFIHYSQYQKEFGLISDCAADSLEPLGSRCKQREMDVVDYRDMSDFAADPDYASFSWAVQPRAVDATGRVRRGYLFSSDEYADTGNVPSFSMDSGADAYEQVRFLESTFENRYILDAFRRNRVEFNSFDVTARIQYRYLDKIQQISKAFAFGAVLDGDPTQPAAGLLEDGNYGPLQLAATHGLDLFARILTRPEPGHYCPADVCGSGQPVGVATELFTADAVALPDVYLYDFRVALGDGRYLHNDFDYSQGYFWGDYQSQVGTYYEKIWATYYLSEAFDSFVSNSKEDFYDSRYKNVSFATIYPEQVRRLYSALLTGDLDTFAPWVVVKNDPNNTPLGSLQYPNWHDAKDLGTRPANAKLADPNYGWNSQLYAMVWGSMYFPTNWSSSWVHDARIAVLPNETPDWPADEVMKFSYPVTGMTYRAHRAGTEQLMGQVRERAIGARMLAWANHLMALAYKVQLDVNGKPLFNPDGTPMLELDVNGKPQLDAANPGAAAALAKYVDSIDIFRQLTSKFELPLYDGELPSP